MHVHLNVKYVLFVTQAWQMYKFVIFYWKVNKVLKKWLKYIKYEILPDNT